MWGVSGALDGAGGVRTACSPLQMLQGLAPAQSSGSVCVCAHVRVGQAGGGQPGRSLAFQAPWHTPAGRPL